MPSGAEFADRILKELRAAVAQPLAGIQNEIAGFENELRAYQEAVRASLDRLSQAARPLGTLELPAAEQLFDEAVAEATASAAADASERSMQALREAEERAQGALREQEERSRRAQLEVEERLREALRQAAEASRSADDDARTRERAAVDALSQSVRRIRRGETQEELLTALLEGAAEQAPRVALLVNRGESLVGWAARGLSPAGAERLAGLSLSPAESPLLRAALASDESRTAEEIEAEPSLSGVLETEAQAPLFARALRALGKPVAVVVAASGAGAGWDRAALDLLVEAAGLSIENLALRILQELGAPHSAPVEARQPRPAAVEPGPAHGAPEVHEAPEPVASPGADEAPGDPAIPARQAAAGQPQAAAPVPAAPQAAAPAATERHEPTEEERLHSEAKRFARLLVSEIKLYNEQRVIEGRGNRDLYVRLKRDIDRSREMYDKRVSPLVARKVDYFHDELIRILGENDSSKLGSDYPGSRVES